MIDKDLFPKEYAAIERLKENSRRIQKDLDHKREAKQKKIEECRRILYGDDYTGWSS